MNLTLKAPSGRGCGTRKSDSPYLCCGLSMNGLPIENFMYDPAQLWEGGLSRAPKIMPRYNEDGTPTGVNDIVIFVGKESYPTIWDFIEEARRYGVSRKVSKNMPFSKLTPRKSLMVFVHARAIYDGEYKVPEEGEFAEHCKKRYEEKVFPEWMPVLHPTSTTQCIFSTKGLAISWWVKNNPDHVTYTQKTMMGKKLVKNASYSFVSAPAEFPDGQELDDDKWLPGKFLALPLTHIEAKDRLDKHTRAKILNTGYAVEILEY